MKRLEIRPDGWPVKLKDCPAGFFTYEGQLCFKTEYGEKPEVYNSAGEYFHLPDVTTSIDDAKVPPVEYVWTDDE
jgi:hypothetical protein